MKRFLSSVVLTLTALTGFCAEPMIHSGDRIAFYGDSITAQRLYTKYIDAYITMCSGLKDVSMFNFGLGCDTAPRAAERMKTYMLDYWHPTFVTVCFGMNDWSTDVKKQEIFRNGMDSITEQARAAGARVMLFSPTICGLNPKNPKVHEVFELFITMDKAIAEKRGASFCDFHHPMLDVLRNAVVKYGPDFPLAGKDNVHPRESGHMVMANEALKTMNFDGEIGTFTMDLKSADATASAGHTVLEKKPGEITVESSRYPFCFPTEDLESANNPASILQWIDFQSKLNRFTLRVTGLDADKAEVRWGDEAKTFSRAELENGVNLADAFRTNPFSKPFDNVMSKLAAKGYFETIVYAYITPCILRMKWEDYEKDASVDPFIEKMRADMLTEWARREADVRAAFTPVKHTIKVIPAK